MIKILLVDLDGTCRESINGDTFINDPYNQKLIDGVQEAIARYHDWKIIGITNQGGVIAGKKSLENCFEEQRQTLKLIPQMWMILFCTDNGSTMFRLSQRMLELHGMPVMVNRPNFGNFRKPNPGMINFALKLFKEKPEQILMVGDRPEDQQAAANAGINFMWAEDWRNGKSI
jgi:D-glycero-D-manno-heptose 1,7-bisphosphate phosphatase